jgi:hypothetical protein
MKITKAQLKEIIKEETVKLKRKIALENKNKLNEGKDTGNPYDLNNPSNLEEFYNKIVDVWTIYCGQRANDAGVSNDNRAILYNLLESGELAQRVNQMWSPNSLAQNKNGTDYFTNNPEDMEAHLSNMGYSKGSYTLSPGIASQGKEVDELNESDDLEGDERREREHVIWDNKKMVEKEALNSINELIATNPVNIYDSPYNGTVRKGNISHVPQVSRVQMPHQGESWSNEGSASIEFEDRGGSWLEISTEKVKGHGSGIPNETYRNTDKEGLHTLLGVVKKITKESGYWSDVDVQKIMRNAMMYFGQFVIDVDNLEVID